jgi:LPXTG-motif cell wall-anchored protein
LKDAINVEIVADDIGTECDIYSEDVVGVLQNDPYYAYDGGLDLKLANIPQKQLAHNAMGAEATVNERMVNMLADGNSVNALAPLTIVNTRGFDLPKTGDVGTWMYGAFGIGIMATAAGAIIFVLKKKENEAV